MRSTRKLILSVAAVMQVMSAQAGVRVDFKAKAKPKLVSKKYPVLEASKVLNFMQKNNLALSDTRNYDVVLYGASVPFAGG